MAPHVSLLKVGLPGRAHRRRKGFALYRGINYRLAGVGCRDEGLRRLIAGWSLVQRATLRALLNPGRIAYRSETCPASRAIPHGSTVLHLYCRSKQGLGLDLPISATSTIAHSIEVSPHLTHFLLIVFHLITEILIPARGIVKVDLEICESAMSSAETYW